MKQQHPTEFQVQACNKPIARADIRNLLRAYSGAIALDQIRVDALPAASFHPEYSRGMWLRSRRDHVTFINQLARTTRDMSKELLQNINLVASTREPNVVRKAVVGLLSMGANGELEPGPIDTASLFFSMLVENVGTGWIGFGDDVNAWGVNAKMRFANWLDLIDPLSLAKDPECQYYAQLTDSVKGKGS